MNMLKSIGKFWYHFIVGDDWRIAVGVVVGLCLVALFVHILHINAWWLLPVIVCVMLPISLWRAVRN